MSSHGSTYCEYCGKKLSSDDNWNGSYHKECWFSYLAAQADKDIPYAANEEILRRRKW